MTMLQRARPARRRLRHEVFERDAAARAATALRFAVETLATLRDFARRRGVFDDEELIARHRHAAECRAPAPESPDRPT